MDNKAYLDSIAVKGQKEKEPILSPNMIKFIVFGLVAFIFIMVLGSVLNSTKSKTTDDYARLYLRISTLASDTGPLETYQDKIKSSTLRQNNYLLKTSLLSSLTSITPLMQTVGVDTTNISSKISEEENLTISSFSTALDQAYLIGNFDRTYSTEALYQVQMLLILEKDIRNKTANEAFAAQLDSSIEDLTIIENNYKQYIYAQ